MNCLKKEICLKEDSNNKIWCNYTCVSGGKIYNLLLSIIIITIPYILLLSILISCKNNLLIIYPLIISSLLYLAELLPLIKTACTDPGIIHRQENIYNYKPNKYYIKKVINGHLYELKFCLTCHVFNSPRADHCHICDNCILRFDHHCNWIGQCIGQKNYGSFYSLVFSLFFTCLFYIIYSLFYIIYQAKKYINKEKYNKLILWGLTVIALYNIIFLLAFVGKLFLTHTYLLIYNKTFYEYLKNKFSYIPGMNPFKNYILYVCKRLVLKCPGKSFYLNFIKHNEKLKSSKADNESFLTGEIFVKNDVRKSENKLLPKKNIKIINISKKEENNINKNEIRKVNIYIDEQNNIIKEFGNINYNFNDNIKDKNKSKKIEISDLYININKNSKDDFIPKKE